MAGEQSWILRGSRREVGYRCELRARSGERQRDDPHLSDVRVDRHDFDIGDAGNHVRRPDRHQQTVGSGRGVHKDVGAADVGAWTRRPRDRRGSQRDPAAARHHRLTFCITRPACRPAQAIRHEVTPAMSIPRQNPVAVASRALNRYRA